MGIINIQIRGSFGNKPDTEFSATQGGHAYALTRAISYLLLQMGDAIKKDHALHDNGEHPNPDFGKSVTNHDEPS